MARITWLVVGIACLAAGAGVAAYRVKGDTSPLHHAHNTTREALAGSKIEDAPPLSPIQRAVVNHVLEKRAEKLEAEPASFVVKPNPHITDDDRKVRIPANTEDALRDITRALNLTELEQRRTKNLLGVFAKGQELLASYPEPARTEKRFELQRQFRLAMHTALPHEKEDASDRYFETSQ